MHKIIITYWLPLLVWMGLIFFLSHQDGPSSQALSDWVKMHIKSFLELLGWVSSGKGGGYWGWIIRKMAHASEYAILAVLAFRLFHYYHFSNAINWAFAFSVLYAVSDEWHQSFIPGRGASLWDVGIDSLGAGLAALVLWGYYVRTYPVQGPPNTMEK